MLTPADILHAYSYVTVVRLERYRLASGLYHCATCADERTVRLVPDSGTWSAAGPGDDPCPDCTDGGTDWVDCPVCGLRNGVPSGGECLSGCGCQSCECCCEVSPQRYPLRYVIGTEKRGETLYVCRECYVADSGEEG
jgi:hypothetical protein